jgi:hypothetical protein
MAVSTETCIRKIWASITFFIQVYNYLSRIFQIVLAWRLEELFYRMKLFHDIKMDLMETGQEDANWIDLIFNLRYSINVKDQVSHPYNKTGCK